jgi:hypothetical protein
MQRHIHVLTGIRTHDPGVRTSEDSSCLIPRGHCDRQSIHHIELSNIRFNIIRRLCLLGYLFPGIFLPNLIIKHLLFHPCVLRAPYRILLKCLAVTGSLRTPGVAFLTGAWIILIATSCRRALTPTPLLVQLVPGPLSAKVKLLRREYDH